MAIFITLSPQSSIDTTTMTDHLTNPFLSLPYESAMQDLGDQYYDQVAAADFPSHILRFRKDALLPLVGIQ
ncbi:MAG: protein adenylyltransferase SelO family protein, partial [Microcystis sp.]